MSLEKLQLAFELLIDTLKSDLVFSELRKTKYEVQLIFSNQLVVYLRYNIFEEYGYNIIFSDMPYDRIRFDNLDDRWEVDTKPHHQHIRRKKQAISSPMNGNPAHDIPILVEFLKKYI